jgi:hypothetical protein
MGCRSSCWYSSLVMLLRQANIYFLHELDESVVPYTVINVPPLLSTNRRHEPWWPSNSGGVRTKVTFRLQIFLTW